MHYRQASQVKIKRIGDSTALYVGRQKGIHVLNETALFIWEALEEPFTADELLFMLTEVFDADPTTMKADLNEILDLFLHYDLIRTEA
jgi:hypothetical protein